VNRAEYIDFLEGTITHLLECLETTNIHLATVGRDFAKGQEAMKDRIQEIKRRQREAKRSLVP